ncbi:MAG TPA: CBS domain-containing protein [Planctomycetota bacterium]
MGARSIAPTETEAMKVHQLMNGPGRTCGPRDSLQRAAQLLWEHDCGMLPVVDDTGRVRGVITDRDICMGAYTRGECLSDLTVAKSMSPTVVTCRPDDDVAVAAQRMAENAVRRLPVVDDKGRVQGVLSLNDLARAGAKDKDAAQAAGRVLEMVSRPRPAAAPARPGAVRQDAGTRATPPPPATTRGAALLASKIDSEC